MSGTDSRDEMNNQDDKDIKDIKAVQGTNDAKEVKAAGKNAPQKKRKHKVRNRVIVICAIALVVLIAIGLVIGNIIVEYALSPSSSSDKRNVEGSTDYVFESAANEQAIANAYKATTTPTSITSDDGLKLHADYTRNEVSHIWVIAIHGYKTSNESMMNYGARYADRGYNVLLPDNRAHGQSEGKYIGMGWLDKDDIACWIKWIVDQDKDAKIILHGVSMGAATAMMLSGDNPKHVIGYIEDCGYTTVWDIFASEMKKRSGVPSFPALNLGSFVSSFKAGYSFEEASAVKQVAKCKKPMLFIHGEDDDFVPVEMGYEVYDAANCEKQFFLVEDAGHAQALYKDPDAYWGVVFDFIDNVIKP